MKAMLFAAGLGTRLKPFTNSAPKALAKVGDKTLLEHNIRYLGKYGVTDIIINVHHFASMIEETLQQHGNFGGNITISDERDEVLETGGGLKKASWFFGDDRPFVVMNVDILTNLDLGALIAEHDRNQAMATLAVMQRDSSRQLLFDGNMTLCGWQNNHTGEQKIARSLAGTTAYAFSGIQVVSPAIWNDSPFTGKFSMIDCYLHAAKHNVIKGYDHGGDVFIDVGKPESIAKAEQLFKI